MIYLANIFVGTGYFFAGVVLCFVFLWWKDRNARALQTIKGQSILEKSKRDAEAIIRDARLIANEEALKLREKTEQSFDARRQERAELERRLSDRETLLNAQLEKIVQSEASLQEQKAVCLSQADALAAQQRELQQITQKRRDQLQTLSRLTEGEARAQFLKEIEQEALQDASTLSRHILDEAKTRAEEKARQIISLAIQRYASEHTFETTTATIALQGEDMKGRIIGRDGRNIRAFEAATGITVMIDDTPNAVVLSGFDPVRREIAREAMTRLILDGRIHPTRIEEVVAKVSEEMDETIVRLGEEAVVKTGLPLMHAEIIKLLGRLHFRHSYAQNVLDHSIEVAHLMGLMAAELGIDTTLAKRAGLLHDIGKAVNHEVEGPHALVGAEFIKRYGETEAVVNGVASHHNDVPPVGPLGILVSAADAISASRPGARSENMATYLKRVDDLEKIALSFPGVEKCFAVHAGRELRVLVQPDQITDEQAFALARNIALKIEDGLQYPGQIKITVIRETRCVEVAK
ncbi:MAG: 2,3 cyclic-nucleotide 2-phosphodiesterase [Pedosphaera sp.]|nr:2,3 cyclic-nucleotide 2-phosphodiesterase [Pedosphaera sp.]